MGGSPLRSNKVTQLFRQTSDLREFELPHAMRLQTVGAPDAPDQTNSALDLARHHRPCQVNHLDRRIGQRQRGDALNHVRFARGPALVAQQPVDTFGGEALLPLPDAGLDYPFRRAIWTVPIPAVPSSVISARQTCLCEVVWSRTSAPKRR